MPRYSIPDQLLSGFEQIDNTPLEKIEDLAKLISSFPAGIGANDFMERVQNKIDGIQNLARSVFNLGNVLYNETDPIPTIAKELASSFIEQTNKNLNINIDDLSNKLETILSSCEPLKKTFKALSLLTENCNVFRTAKIISDLRLVFNDNLQDENRNALIIHRLRIEYMKDGKVSELYFSLDSTDLQKFKDQIERAVEKDKIIRSSYCNSFSFIDLNE